MRFLNSVGGGIVRSFKGKDQVMVEDEDGFEIPAFIRECVVVGDREMQVHSTNRPKMQAPVEPEPEQKPEPEAKAEETSEGERLNVYLAFLPSDTIELHGVEMQLDRDGVLQGVALALLEGDQLHADAL